MVTQSLTPVLTGAGAERNRPVEVALLQTALRCEVGTVVDQHRCDMIQHCATPQVCTRKTDTQRPTAQQIH